MDHLIGNRHGGDYTTARSPRIGCRPMPRYAAFMRAINIAGRRVKGGELRALFERMGFHDVAVYRASGNVVFAADDRPTAELTARIEESLQAALGYAVVTFLRTAEEVTGMAGAKPFGRDRVGVRGGKLQIALLSTRPRAAERRAVLALATDEDRLAFGARELYWLPTGGMADSELDMNAIARRIGPMTLRTMNTIEQIARKYFADAGAASD
jgi:uncharacterized protein (DUF1697 family)